MQDFSDLMSDLAGQAVQTQKVFDQAYFEDWHRFEWMVGAAGARERELLLPLAPQRMLLRQFEISTLVAIAAGREAGFALQVFPLNLNYSLRHALTYESQSRMTFSVEQVPLGTAAGGEKET